MITHERIRLKWNALALCLNTCKLWNFLSNETFFSFFLFAHTNKNSWSLLLLLFVPLYMCSVSQAHTLRIFRRALLSNYELCALWYWHQCRFHNVQLQQPLCAAITATTNRFHTIRLSDTIRIDFSRKFPDSGHAIVACNYHETVIDARARVRAVHESMCVSLLSPSSRNLFLLLVRSSSHHVCIIICRSFSLDSPAHSFRVPFRFGQQFAIET